MAKLGRYSANRFKVEAISADHTLTVDDCGKMLVTSPGGGGLTITLPSATAAGAGWWVRIVKADEGTDLLVVATSTLDGQAIDANSVNSLSNNFSIDGNAGKGSWVEIWSDGTQYYATGIADDNTGYNP